MSIIFQMPLEFNLLIFLGLQMGHSTFKGQPNPCNKLICKPTETEWQKFEINRTNSKEVVNLLNIRSIGLCESQIGSCDIGRG